MLKYCASIIGKTINEKLAEYIWGEDQNPFLRGKNAWPCIFFLDKIKKCNIPWDIIRKLLNYDSKYFLRTFIRMNNNAQKELFKKYKTFNNFIKEESMEFL